MLSGAACLDACLDFSRTLEELLLSDLLRLWLLWLLLFFLAEFRLCFLDLLLPAECSFFLDSLDCVLGAPFRDLLARRLGEVADWPAGSLCPWVLLNDLEYYLPRDPVLCCSGVRCSGPYITTSLGMDCWLSKYLVGIAISCPFIC